jgi:hypothetical protein
MLGTFETDDNFGTLRQKHTANPIDIQESKAMLSEFLSQAANNIINPDIFAKIMGPAIHTQGDLDKALYLLLSDADKLDHLVTTSNNQHEAFKAEQQLDRIGHYNTTNDSVHVEPLLNPEVRKEYQRGGDILESVRLFRQMLGTLRHELSHREQTYKSYDSLAKGHKYREPNSNPTADQLRANARVAEFARYDPNVQLQFELNDDDWTQKPTEWTAVADEAGYMMREVFNYLNLPNNNDELEDELYNLGSNFSRIINTFQWLMKSDESSIAAAAKHARDVWLNRVRESYELGNVKISDERLKNKLVKAGEGYKGTSNIREQLLAEAAANGVTGETAEALINQVLEKINNTETNQVGKTLGQAQDPNARYRRMASIISQLRSY